MNKILIIRLSSLGDIVLTQPVASVLSKKFPEARIDFLTKPAYSEAVRAFGCVNNILIWTDKPRVISRINKTGYDLIIDLHSKLNTLIIKTLIRSPRKITYRKMHWKRWLITRRIIRKANPHMSELYLRVLRKIGIRTEQIYPRLFPLQVFGDKIDELLEKIGSNRKRIGVFPGTLHYTKQYPVEQMLEFIRQVPENWNSRFIILGSNREKPLGRILSTQVQQNVTDLTGRFNLGELIYLISKLDIIITGDTGPMHIAAALKKPQIAIFGSTHPHLGFSPLNHRAEILSAELDCQPCSLHGREHCPRDHFNCMRLITPEKVRTHLEILLMENQ